MPERTEHEVITWTEGGGARAARWLSASHPRPPARVTIAGDETRADQAYRQACEGRALLWRGDYHNARQLLAALGRRVDGRGRGRRKNRSAPASPAEAFHRHRMQTAHKARLLSMLLVELGPDGALELRRAPDVRRALAEALGSPGAPSVMPLSELLGVIGAHEWRKKGIALPMLEARIHPHYGVFAPIRREYVELIAKVPLPPCELALDVGTGTGVLAAVLAARGVAGVIATDDEPRAVACARENMARLGFENRVEVILADLFPESEHAREVSLIVCNPPWIPAKAVTSLERAVYDPGSTMLERFLNGAKSRLAPDGEVWLVLSDLAELVELRTRAELLALVDDAGFRVIERSDSKPGHPRAAAPDDPLHEFRKRETISLWRLAPRLRARP